MHNAYRTVQSNSSEAELTLCQEFRHRDAKVLGWNCRRRHRSTAEDCATPKCWRWVCLCSCCIWHASSGGRCSANTGAPGADQSAAAALCAEFPADLSSIMSVAIEAALKPMKERLEATILPMLRTLEGLQAEIVALRAEEKDDMMTAGAAADAKRLRMDA